MIVANHAQHCHESEAFGMTRGLVARHLSAHDCFAIDSMRSRDRICIVEVSESCDRASDFLGSFLALGRRAIREFDSSRNDRFRDMFALFLSFLNDASVRIDDEERGS